MPHASSVTALKKILRAAEQDRPDVQERRAAWQQEQPRLDPDKVVFLDEPWAKTNMTRRYGRSPVGERLVDAVPHGHGQTTTLVAALRSTGMTAPTVIDGAVNGDLFVAYVQQQLVPTLQPGDVVIMDNLSSHHRVEVRQAIEAVGAELRYLPPYSPDFNPIEQAFAKLKHLIRSAKQRTVDGLWQFLGTALDAFSPAECRNYIQHAGYRGHATD